LASVTGQRRGDGGAATGGIAVGGGVSGTSVPAVEVEVEAASRALAADGWFPVSPGVMGSTYLNILVGLPGQAPGLQGSAASPDLLEAYRIDTPRLKLKSW
jgi:hypothetical protein